MKKTTGPRGMVPQDKVTEDTPMPTSRETEKYFEYGLTYYVSARFACLAGFMPTCGFLSHYALEMFLKGQLSIRNSEDQLRRWGHDLNALWAAFKAEFPATDFTGHDATVADIDDFWLIRYPETLIREGMHGTVNWSGLPGPPATGSSQLPMIPVYNVSLHSLDALVRTLFTVCSINPAFFGGRYNETARQYLFERNQFFTPATLDTSRKE
jgi:hypothetical protein